MRLQTLFTLLVAALLGALASFGVYHAAQPAAFNSSQPIYTYGTSN